MRRLGRAALWAYGYLLWGAYSYIVNVIGYRRDAPLDLAVPDDPWVFATGVLVQPLHDLARIVGAT